MNAAQLRYLGANLRETLAKAGYAHGDQSGLLLAQRCLAECAGYIREVHGPNVTFDVIESVQAELIEWPHFDPGQIRMTRAVQDILGFQEVEAETEAAEPDEAPPAPAPSPQPVLLSRLGEALAPAAGPAMFILIGVMFGAMVPK